MRNAETHRMKNRARPSCSYFLLAHQLAPAGGLGLAWTGLRVFEKTPCQFERRLERQHCSQSEDKSESSSCEAEIIPLPVHSGSPPTLPDTQAIRQLDAEQTWRWQNKAEVVSVRRLDSVEASSDLPNSALLGAG